MHVRRRGAMVAATGIIAALMAWPAPPASAHGAPSNPVSRAFACRPEAPTASSAACRAAVTANGGALGSWDNLRVPGINGQDRRFIPDGQLCSASLPEFRGLDLARADWPATTVTAGGTLTIRYASTIPHSGSFRVFLTRAGYDPARPLSWSDLDADPIATVTDPPLADGAYRFTATLPADRSGRHVLYTVWQNTSTPDTYYSCSDLDVRTAGAAGAAPPAPRPPAGRSTVPARPAAVPPGAPSAATSAVPSTVASASGSRAPGAPTAGLAKVPPLPPTEGAVARAGHESWLGAAEPVIGDRVALGQQIMNAALIVLFGVTGALAWMRIRAARTAPGTHRRPENR
jgi:predicted carbohydrate-binding protein with CBM5 and CBM33 domain